MSASVTVTTTRTRRNRRAGTPRPRLLLPPVPEPELRPEVTTALALMPPSVRSVHSSVTESAWPFPPPTRSRRAEPATTPPPAPVCASVVVAAVEVLAGTRPLAQLVRWVSPQVYDALALRVEQRAPGPARRAAVRRTRVCWVDERVVEATVVVHDGVRVRAAAVRLELRRGQWRATVLQIG